MGYAVDILMGKVFPSFGQFTNFCLFVAPWREIQAIRSSGHVGHLTPLPYQMMFFQCVNWIIYGFFLSDLNFIPINFLGIALGMHYTLVYHGALKDPKIRTRMECVQAAVSVLPEMMAMIAKFAFKSGEDAKFFFGIFCNIISVSFNASPLTNAIHVIRTKDASSISFALTSCILLNATVWTGYGVYLQNVLVWLPNGLAFISGLLQLTLRLCYGAKTAGMTAIEVNGKIVPAVVGASETTAPVAGATITALFGDKTAKTVADANVEAASPFLPARSLRPSPSETELSRMDGNPVYEAPSLTRLSASQSTDGLVNQLRDSSTTLASPGRTPLSEIV